MRSFVDRVIIQPRDKCDTSKVDDNFKNEFKKIAQVAKETIYTSAQVFKTVKKGEELKF